MDERLGYSLAVPRNWVPFDLQSGDVDRLASLLGGEAAAQPMREFLDTPEGKNLGALAVEPDMSQLFASPPFPMFLNVSTASLSDNVTAEQWVAFVKRSLSAFGDFQLDSIELGTINSLPALQVVGVSDLSSMGIDVTAHLVITILRANQTAYTLTIATRSNTASAKQQLIDQIVGTFRPDIPASAAIPTLAPTATRTPVSAATRIPTPAVTATRTPVSTATRIPAPAPTAMTLTAGMGSRRNPVPFGLAVKVNNWEITVVETIADATQDILRKNNFNDPPDEGNQFFMVTVKAKYVGPGSTRFNGSFRLRALGPSGVVYTTFENRCGVIPNGLPDPELFRGGQIEGAECWQIVSEDAESLVMILDPDFFSDGERVWFSTQDNSPGGTEVESVAMATPSATPIVTIPRGWKAVMDERLGYSLAVPATWLTFDLQRGKLARVADYLGGAAAAKELNDFLSTPEGQNLGVLAVEPDMSQLFANPPFPMFLNVSISPLADDVTEGQLIDFMERTAGTFGTAELISVEPGTINNLPGLQVVATSDLTYLGDAVNARLVITVLRANDTAYILVIGTRPEAAGAKQATIDQIVGTFRPE